MPDKPFSPTNVLLMPNIALSRAKQLCAQIAAFLDQNKVQNDTFPYDFEHPSKLPDLAGRDLLLVIGGDGTLLRAGHLCAPLGIPLLGVQAGRLGFLVELSEHNLEPSITRLLKADYRLENRMMLQASLFDKASQLVGSWDVINEIVICRGREVRPVEIRVDLKEGYLTSYIADGLIVSTATGSTAYALAAGGPILPPELRNMLILPIAPHLSLDRAVVLAEGVQVVLRAQSEFQVVLSVDGMDPIPLSADDTVQVAANQHSLRMVRFGEPNYFYRDLADVLHRNPVLQENHHDG